MKSIRYLLVLIALSVCVLSSYVTQKDEKYVQYFLHLYSSGLFRERNFVMKEAKAVIGKEHLKKIEMSFSSYKSLTLDRARELITSVAMDLVDRVNKDSVLNQRGLLGKKPFLPWQVRLHIRNETPYGESADWTTSIRQIVLDEGRITYITDKNMPAIWGKSLTIHEDFEYALMLVGKARPADTVVHEAMPNKGLQSLRGDTHDYPHKEMPEALQEKPPEVKQEAQKPQSRPITQQKMLLEELDQLSAPAKEVLQEVIQDEEKATLNETLKETFDLTPPQAVDKEVIQEPLLPIPLPEENSIPEDLEAPVDENFSEQEEVLQQEVSEEPSPEEDSEDEADALIHQKKMAKDLLREPQELDLQEELFEALDPASPVQAQDQFESQESTLDIPSEAGSSEPGLLNDEPQSDDRMSDTFPLATSESFNSNDLDNNLDNNLDSEKDEPEDVKEQKNNAQSEEIIAFLSELDALAEDSENDGNDEDHSFTLSTDGVTNLGDEYDTEPSAVADDDQVDQTYDEVDTEEESTGWMRSFAQFLGMSDTTDPEEQNDAVENDEMNSLQESVDTSNSLGQAERGQGESDEEQNGWQQPETFLVDEKENVEKEDDEVDLAAIFAEIDQNDDDVSLSELENLFGESSYEESPIERELFTDQDEVRDEAIVLTEENNADILDEEAVIFEEPRGSSEEPVEDNAMVEVAEQEEIEQAELEQGELEQEEISEEEIEEAPNEKKGFFDSVISYFKSDSKEEVDEFTEESVEDNTTEEVAEQAGLEQGELEQEEISEEEIEEAPSKKKGFFDSVISYFKSDSKEEVDEFTEESVEDDTTEEVAEQEELGQEEISEEEIEEAPNEKKGFFDSVISYFKSDSKEETDEFTEESVEDNTTEEVAEQEELEQEEISEEEIEEAPNEKKGFFDSVISYFKSDSKDEATKEVESEPEAVSEAAPEEVTEDEKSFFDSVEELFQDSEKTATEQVVVSNVKEDSADQDETLTVGSLIEDDVDDTQEQDRVDSKQSPIESQHMAVVDMGFDFIDDDEQDDETDEKGLFQSVGQFFGSLFSSDEPSGASVEIIREDDEQDDGQ